MDKPSRHELADTLGADVGRAALLQEIVGKVEGVNASLSDDELDLWWGTVEIDRLASGLTLAAINKLSASNGDDYAAGPWLQLSDATGDEPTRLTPEGRQAVRRIGAAEVIK
jgi:hypothetical protein